MDVMKLATGLLAKKLGGNLGGAALNQAMGSLLGQSKEGAVSYTHLTLPTICSV